MMLSKRGKVPLRLGAGLVLVSLFAALPVSAQTTVAKKDGRFMATLDERVADPFGNLNTRGFLDSFQLKLQWWTLLGEPIELYHILWRDTDQYEIDDRVVRRSDLAKYPDLLKRFEALRPSKFSIRVTGRADGGTVSAKRGRPASGHGFNSGPGIAYKRNGQAYDRYHLYGDFVYIVEDRLLLTTRSGKLGDGIVPNSPDWNTFLHWGATDGYRRGDPKDAALKRLNKGRFERARSVTLSAEIAELEWPESEMRAIAKRFDEYESGEREPSPEEQVAAAQEEVRRTGPYRGDDFWSTPPEPVKRDLEMFKDGGKWGLRDKETHRVIVAPRFKFQEKHKFPNTDQRFWKARIAGEKGLNGNFWIVVDHTGTQAHPGKFHYVGVGNPGDTFVTASRILSIGKQTFPDNDYWCDSEEEDYRFDKDWNVISKGTRSHNRACHYKGYTDPK